MVYLSDADIAVTPVLNVERVSDMGAVRAGMGKGDVACQSDAPIFRVSDDGCDDAVSMEVNTILSGVTIASSERGTAEVDSSGGRRSERHKVAVLADTKGSRDRIESTGGTEAVIVEEAAHSMSTVTSKSVVYSRKAASTVVSRTDESVEEISMNYAYDEESTVVAVVAPEYYVGNVGSPRGADEPLESTDGGRVVDPDVGTSISPYCSRGDDEARALGGWDQDVSDSGATDKSTAARTGMGSRSVASSEDIPESSDKSGSKTVNGDNSNPTHTSHSCS